MRLMYDSVNAAAIPTNAQLVAGYVHPSGFAWSDAAWARFPSSVHVRITPQVTTTGVGIHVLDVENGDATPSQAPGWVKAQRALGQDPTVYCSSSIWAQVQAACNATGVAQPNYWIAAYPGTGQNLPTLNGITAVAHQYADPGPYDLSVVADFWPGVDGADDTLALTDVVTDPTTGKALGTVNDVLAYVDKYVSDLENKVNDPNTGLVANLATANKNIEALQAAQPSTVTLSPDQLTAFESATATAVQSAVAGLNLAVSPADQAAIAAAVAKELGAKLSA